MISDHDLALACQATYAGTPQTWGTNIVHVFLSQVNGVNIYAFEGTSTPREWMIDILGATPEEAIFDHVDFGLCHRGWYQDVLAVRDQLIAHMRISGTPSAITGHSKGASEALIMGAEATIANISLIRLSTFGTPRPGGLGGILKGIPGTDWRNLDDGVWDVPPYLPRAEFRNEGHMAIQPLPDDEWGLLAPHHIELYVAGAP